MSSNLVGIIIYSILFISLVIVIIIVLINKKDSNVKKDDYNIDYNIDEHNVVESVSSSLEKYTEIKIGDSMSKVIECLGYSYTSYIELSADDNNIKLVWENGLLSPDNIKKVNGCYCQKVVVEFKDNMVIKLQAKVIKHW